jgi:hypothetical protein
MKISVISFSALLASGAHGYVSRSRMTASKHSTTSLAVEGRRDMMQKVGTAFVAAAAVVATGNVEPANAVLAVCPKSSKNCLRTVWTPPANYSKSQAIAVLRETLKEYPQEGQQKADMGGYKVVSDDLEGASSLARVEYTSGVGFFSKAFNGGKPFVDDLELEVDSNGATEIRSSSRIGESDMGVNKKRIDYLAGALTQKGWLCSSAEYGKQ